MEITQPQTFGSEAISTPTIGGARRFAFGENWARFVQFVDDSRIKAAEDSLSSYLGDIHSKTFLDIGSGSGLFSLAARRLGAQVRSFDFDARSVACTQELKRRYLPGDPDWIIEQGDALNQEYLANLGQFDVVYSWGVLHVTGSMWEAIGNAAKLVKPRGLFYIALNNDQGGPSRRWIRIKKMYNNSGPVIKSLLAFATGAFFEARRIMVALRDKQNPFKRSMSERGMLFKTDLIDWVGGWPFEVATPDAVFDFCKAQGFSLEKLKTRKGVGCNEFVFKNQASNSR
jgi:2-polyprenyl-6-hydroxyphenyl methylase/3-demethylubiquinone-9 3-methyltransferase